MDYCEDCEGFVEAVVTFAENHDAEMTCPICGGDNIVTPQEDDWREDIA